MAMGMSRDEYWNGDPSAVIDYRKADKIRTNRRNYEAWLQGLYIYDAYTCVAPVLIPFNKNARISPYPKEPYILFADERKEKAKQEEIERDKRNQAQVKAWFKRVNERKGSKTE
jgi:hypothetical protein